GRPFVDIDRLIEQRAGAAIALIFDLEGETGFRRREREMLAEQLAGTGSVIACGGGVVLEPDNRVALRARSFVIHLVASVDEQLARLARDRTRPLLQTDDRRSRLEALAAHRDPLYADVADLRYHPGDTTAAFAARELADQLENAPTPPWTTADD